MKCDREKLSHYVDGELEPDEVRQLQQHLAECETCTADLAAFREVNDTIGRLGQARAPGELRRQVYHRVEEQRRSRLRWGWAAPLARPAVPITLGLFMMAGAAAAWRVLLPAGSAPVMTAAFAVQETPDSLDGLRVELVFDRPVAPDSVAQAIVVDPHLPLSHRVRENKVELVPEVPIQPGASYRVTVSNVRDQRGNVQSSPIVFNLTTAPVAMLSQESSPAQLEPEVSGALAPSAQPVPTVAPAAELLENYPDVKGRLGDATGPERSVRLIEQSFQGGTMLARGDTERICALVRASGRFDCFANTWRPGEVLPPAGQRPPGTFEPLRGFGKVWRNEPSVKLQLGWPVYEERAALGSLQSFRSGTLIRSVSGVAYVLFEDGAWRVLPDPRR